MNLSKYSNDFPNLLYIIRNNRNLKYPEFTTFESRLKTFDLYTLKYPDKFSLYETRFKYLGTRDCTQCFNCGVVLSDWAIVDNPRKERAFHSSKFTFE
ncbi:BIR repeat [Cinara cedri]|uniref:BIR repeat n=1 Tax=Cinara cedri TaxID=506608 RepID=A0A5E4MA15_9HEMI|nr:BIR repeat [Cinara cedri]